MRNKEIMICKKIRFIMYKLERSRNYLNSKRIYITQRMKAINRVNQVIEVVNEIIFLVYI